MNSAKSRSTRAASVIVMLLLVGCGAAEPVATSSPVPPSPEPTTAPAVPEAHKGEEWDYVAIGDGDTWGFFNDYAAYLEDDLGVQVTVDDWHLDKMTSGSLLTRLQKNEGLRQALGEAEVVTFTAKPMDRIGWQCFTEDESDLDCSPDSLEAFREDYTAIIAEIASLRAGSETIIRTMDLYMPFFDEWQERGIYDECRHCWEAINQVIQEVAAEQGIPMAPVYDTFNGPGHDEDPNDKGYVYSVGATERIIGDVNETGRAVIADLFRELGYEPIVP